MSGCKHNEAHNVVVNVSYMEDSERFSADIKIECGKCGRPFQFLGMPLGLDLEGVSMTVDGQEAHLAIAPVGTVPQPLDAALLRGYRIKLPGSDH